MLVAGVCEVLGIGLNWLLSVGICEKWFSVPRVPVAAISFHLYLFGKEPTCQCRRHETQVRTLGWEDPLEKGMAIQSSIISWRIPSTEEPVGLQSIDLQRVGHNLSDLARVHETSDNVLTVLGAVRQLPRQCLTNYGEARLSLYSLFLLWEKSQSRGISLSTESCWPGIKVMR